MSFFDVFRKRSGGKQKIKEHCKSLIIRYNEYRETCKSSDFSPEIFYNFPDKESFLSHLSTGYQNIYFLFVDYILLKKEIDTQPMKESIWREKTKKASSINLEFRHEFERMLLKITRGPDEFQGICKECKNWHNEYDDLKSKELVSKLNAFKMPF